MSNEEVRLAREAQISLLALLNKGHLYDTEERSLNEALVVARQVESRATS